MKKYIKICWIVPAVFVMSAYDLISDPFNVSAGVLMQNRVFGKLSGSGIDMLAATFNQLYFLVLFQILFGNMIADYFYTGAVYYFTRIPNRGRWFLGKCLELSLLAALYAALFLGSEFLVCARLSRQPLDAGTAAIVFELFAICWYLLFLTTLGINVLAVVFERKTGFIFGYAVMSVCVILALNCRIVWINFLNPFCYFLFGQTDILYNIIRWLYELLLLAVLVFVGNHVVKNVSLL